ncbi:MAG: DNA methyltransferase [Promethearchaeati archaeon]
MAEATQLRRESPTQATLLTRGFVFACTAKNESECLNGPVFATDNVYGPIVIRIRKGDVLFLNNLDTNVLHGVFRAISDGGFRISPQAFGGRYPYQVEVEPIDGILTLTNAKKVLKKLEVKRNTPLFREKLVQLLGTFLRDAQLSPEEQSRALTEESIGDLVSAIQNSNAEVDIETEIPLVEATTLWDFPKQSYGLIPKGNNKYAGVTPALIIYNLVWRYTKPGDLVVDPMCGSGTTIDVCREEKRKVIGYDVSPTRSDIVQNDARKIPLDSNSVDMVFIDSPYGDNVRYSEHPGDIGHISSESEEFYKELEKVMYEASRVLKEDKVLGWLIGDQWVRNQFTPVGYKVYERLCKYLEPIDIVCVTRRGQHSHTGMWLNRARRLNFYLRGFKYLIIMRKPSGKPVAKRTRKIEWTHYKRG